MTTREMVSRLQDITGEAREPILDTINRCHAFILSDNFAQKMNVDESTGLPPFIETIDNQFKYEAPANCREIAGVYIIDTNTRGYNTNFIGGYLQFNNRRKHFRNDRTWRRFIWTEHICFLLEY